MWHLRSLPTSISLAAGLALVLAGAPANAQTDAAVAESNFGLAVDLCLQHVRSRDPVEAFREAGFEVTPADEGTFEFVAPGVSGFLSPLTVLQWCLVETEVLDFATVQRIGHERALYRYPDGVSGAPGDTRTADGCPSLNVAHANRIWTLEFKNVPFWEGCARPDTGGILFN